MREFESSFKIFLVRWVKPFLMECLTEYHNAQEATKESNKLKGKQTSLLTTSEVCEILKCNRHFLYSLIKEGKIVSANIGGGYLFRPLDIQNYIDDIFRRDV